MTRKRIKIKKITPESEALKKVRVSCDKSQSELAELLNISKTSVNHYENGWSAISSDYIDRFLEALCFPQNEWRLLVDPKDHTANLRANCHDLIETIDGEKLNAIHNLLSCFDKSSHG